MNIQATDTTVIYTKRDDSEALRHGSLILTDYLSKDIQWGDVVATGPDSVINPGDQILLSRRVQSYDFEIEGKLMHNTSDASCLAYRKGQEKTLYATGKTFIYQFMAKPEEVTASGIVVVRKETTKERDPVWVKVIAAGKETGIQAGDEALIAYKSDAYTFAIDDLKELHNAGIEECILYISPAKP